MSAVHRPWWLVGVCWVVGGHVDDCVLLPETRGLNTRRESQDGGTSSLPLSSSGRPVVGTSWRGFSRLNIERGLALYDLNALAPTGSTGNATLPAGSGFQAESGGYESLIFQFVVEAAGATPTVTYKYQASPDGTNWYDVSYITDASDTTSQATRTMTAVGAQVSFMSLPLSRRYKYFRVVVTANTNITYRAEMYRVS